MQPVLPSTIVRGPAALTMSFITRADSQPWHVRCPEVKYSSIVTRLTPLKGSRICVALAKVSAILMVSLGRAGRRLDSLAHARQISGYARLAGSSDSHLSHARQISGYGRLAGGSDSHLSHARQISGYGRLADGSHRATRARPASGSGGRTSRPPRQRRTCPSPCRRPRA